MTSKFYLKSIWIRSSKKMVLKLTLGIEQSREWVCILSTTAVVRAVASKQRTKWTPAKIAAYGLQHSTAGQGKAKDSRRLQRRDTREMSCLNYIIQ